MFRYTVCSRVSVKLEGVQSPHRHVLQKAAALNSSSPALRADVLNAAAQVYKAMLRNAIPVAVKVLKDQSYTSREEFQREVGLLKSLHNSNIVQFQVPRPCSRPSAGVTECHGQPTCSSPPVRGRRLWVMRGRFCSRQASPLCPTSPGHAGRVSRRGQDAAHH